MPLAHRWTDSHRAAAAAAAGVTCFRDSLAVFREPADFVLSSARELNRRPLAVDTQVRS
jgi:hypothetical protein